MTRAQIDAYCATHGVAAEALPGGWLVGKNRNQRRTDRVLRIAGTPFALAIDAVSGVFLASVFLIAIGGPELAVGLLEHATR